MREVRGRRLSVAAAIVGLGALSFASGAQACSCAEIHPRAATRQADAAIVGSVVGVVPQDRYSAEYRVRVHRVYKGSGLRVGTTLSVQSGPNGKACGLPSPSGDRYGMFLGRRDGGWRGSLCGLVAAKELAAALSGPQRNRDLDASSSSSAGTDGSGSGCAA